MPLAIEEKVDSRRFTTDKYDRLASITARWMLTGTDDDAEAKQYAQDEIADTYLTLPRANMEFEPESVDTMTGSGRWWVSVRYQHPGRRTPSVEEEPLRTFNTRGGTQHITQAISTIAKQPPAAPDLKGTIGWDGERIKGVDIPVAEYMFSETHYKDDAFVTEAYRQTLLAASGTVNDAPFRGHAIGEVLFLGAAGSQRGDEKWELTYDFAGSPNKTGIVYGDVPAIDKKGWEHIWVRYATVVVADELVPAPKAAYVVQVFYSSDFADLDID